MHERTNIQLSATDRNELELVVASRNSRQKHVWRAKIVLLTANGHGTAEIMRATGKAKTVIWRWQDRPAQWWPNPEGPDCCLGPKAADRLLEIRDCRGRTGRSGDDGRMKASASPFQSPRASSALADPGERTEIWPGSKSRRREWSRPPEPLPDASGILVQPTRESGDRM